MVLRKLNVSILVIILWFSGFSQNVPEGGKVLLSTENVKREVLTKREAGIAKFVNLNGKRVIKATTLQETKHPWYFQFMPAQVKAGVKNGDVMLLTLRAKTVSSLAETGEASLTFKLQQKKTNKAIFQYTLSLSREWKEYYIPFSADFSITKEQLQLGIHAGFGKQEVLISDLKIINYQNNKSIGQLPKTKITYPGMEMDAEWRITALERIEKYRKGNVEFKVYDKKGNPVESAQVSIKMVNHAFRFGTAISAKEFVQNSKYRDECIELFNMAVIENGLKMRHWDRNKEFAIKTLDILNKKNIPVRGHTLVWPGFRHLPKEYKQFQNDSVKIKKMVNSHVEELVQICKGQLLDWDVINEAYTNNDLQKITGSENILYEAFKKAREIDPKTNLYVNEYGIVSAGGLDKKKQDWYYDYCKRVDENTGGLLDGIGLQCHIGTNITPPARVYSLIDRYSKLGKKISITEFTHTINDEVLQASYFRDFYTAVFSHPSVEALLLWGFWEGQMWKPEASLFKKNWQPKLNGRVFQQLVHNEWMTKTGGNTDSEGFYSARGFLGEYEYEVKIKRKTIKGSFNLSNNSEPKKIEVNF
jgi:GH35 family endo-1,4-beta-xylanase